jgi:protein phosphatase
VILVQALRDQGVPPEQIDTRRIHHILTSAIRSSIAPVTTTFDLEWDDSLLLCTDGLTNHLSDDEIRDVLAASSSAKSACQKLVRQAVGRGGAENVTVVVGRLN